MSKMKTITKINGNALILGIPLLMITLMVLIAKSKLFEIDPNTLSVGITADLLFTIPLVYFLLIRKRNIPKTTIVPLFVLGILTASYIIPKEHQSLLNWAKTWMFPVVELGVGFFVFYKVRQTLKRYKEKALQTPDFFSALKETCREILPGKLAMVMAMELAVFYYGFISWKNRLLSKNEFSYHKNSGTIALLVALIGIIGIETYAIHVLLLKWSTIAAWIASALSIYSSIQIFGFLKSIMKRPITIEKNTLLLKYGILSEASIPIEDISSIEITSKDIEFDDTTRKLSPLGELETHNIVITLKKENELTGLYGLKKSFEKIAFFIDHKEEFKTELENAIQTLAIQK